MVVCYGQGSFNNFMSRKRRQDNVMSLPTSQQRALDQIERTLTEEHPSLGSQFAIFTKLVGHELMPVTERFTARTWRSRWQGRRMWPTVATLVALAMASALLFTLSLTLPNRPQCTRTSIAIAAHTQSVPAGRQLVCATQQNKPGRLAD
jgi:uncharacterized BrkB/YihY/UPF0761 family membrane protein